MDSPPRADLPTDFMLQSVRVGVRITQMAALLVALTPLLPGTATASIPGFLASVGVAVVLSLLVARTNWEDRLLAGRAEAAFEAWAIALIGVIVAAVGLAGRPDGEGHLFLFLVVVFFALMADGWSYVRITVAALIASLALAVAGDLPVARIVTRVIALGLVAHLANLGRDLLAHRADEAETARIRADQRASLLATVAGSARDIATLDHDAMLVRFVRAAVDLGFETGDVCRITDDTYSVVAPVGHDDHAYTTGVHRADEGMVGLVREARQPVALEDYASHPSGPEGLRREGFRSVVGVPIWTQGRLDACLVVGTRSRSDVPPETVEALELLAALAGRALENATLFEAESHRAEEMERLARLKSDFVSNVSHELRTPLTVIEGIGATLVDRGEGLDGELRRELLQRLNANAASLHGILGRLLDFSRLEAGTLEMHFAETQLGELVEYVGGRLSSLLAQHDFHLDGEPAIPVEADPVLIERVVENLLVNAAKHTPAGTTVRLTAAIVGDRGRVEVRDDGPGIPDDELPHLTQRFYRGGHPDMRERKGLGLGLSLAHELLALHGSGLEVVSEVGVGSTFAFELPLSRQPDRLVGPWDRDLDPRQPA